MREGAGLIDSLKEQNFNRSSFLPWIYLKLEKVKPSHLIIVLLIWIGWQLTSINENLEYISSNTNGIEHNTNKYHY